MFVNYWLLLSFALVCLLCALLNLEDVFPFRYIVFLFSHYFNLWFCSIAIHVS